MKIEAITNTSQPFLINLSPGAGLICSIILISGAIFSQSIIAVSIFFLLALFLSLWKNPFKQILSFLLPTNGFILIIWLTLPFSEQDSIITNASPSKFLSYSGIYIAALLTLKANTSLLFFINFITNNPHKVGNCLQSIGLPNKLITLFILLYQHSIFLHKDILSALQSLSLRAPKLSILNSLKMYAYLIGSILVNNIDRANYVCMVLKRRYSPLVYIEKYPLFSNYIDIFLPLGSLIFTITIIYYTN